MQAKKDVIKERGLHNTFEAFKNGSATSIAARARQAQLDAEAAGA